MKKFQNGIFQLKMSLEFPNQFHPKDAHALI